MEIMSLDEMDLMIEYLEEASFESVTVCNLSTLESP